MSNFFSVIDLTDHIVRYKIQYQQLMDRFKEKELKINQDPDFLFIDLLHICIQTSSNNLLWIDEGAGRGCLFRFIKGGAIPPHYHQEYNFHDYTCYLEESELWTEESNESMSVQDHFKMEIASLMVSWTEDILKQVLRHVIATDVGKAYFNTESKSDLITSVEYAAIFPFRDRGDVMVNIQFNGS
ncbi:MAG: hypothetical protein CL582_10350 [Alteromonadaceae bacterium]|nr:hypothetical protein [Alteromonadaceae bacterium]|tara:strand:+ start:9895 stop:10449 length:555 start_codon:yes stop_codon:yes gene_type:complete